MIIFERMYVSGPPKPPFGYALGKRLFVSPTLCAFIPCTVNYKTNAIIIIVINYYRSCVVTRLR